jgi:predicted RNA-binding protein YlqC (UPF0109 family)
MSQEGNEGGMAQTGYNATSEGTESAPFTLRVLLSSKDAGSFIGKGGSVIKSVREESGARVHISNSVADSPDRVLMVTGTQDQIAFCIELFLRQLQLQLAQAPDAPSQTTQQLTLLVAHQQAGRLIGKGGLVVKDIRETSGATVNVAQNLLPNSMERCVTLSGAVDCVLKAVSRVLAILAENPVKGQPMVPYLPQAAAAPPSFPPQMPTMGYPPQAGAPAMFNPAAVHMPSGFPGVATNTSTQMTIPGDLIGSVIGRGGRKIQEIRHLSGASIKIAGANEAGSGSDRVVTIQGSPEANQLAIFMLQERMKAAAIEGSNRS